MAAPNQQFGAEDRLDRAKADLEAKISQQASRIDGKFSTVHFLWAMGILAGILSILFTAYLNRNDKVDDRLRQAETRLTVIETKINK